MAIYPIHKINKEGTLLGASHSSYTDEYADRVCSLYLSDELVPTDGGRILRRYRLCAQRPHTIEDYLAYDINCPKCHNRLKLVGRALNSHELGLYACPCCDRH